MEDGMIVQARYVGTDMFCPYCQRRLVHVHDGSFDLAGKAYCLTSMVLYGEDGELAVDEDGTAEAFITEATCQLPACRFKAAVDHLVMFAIPRARVRMGRWLRGWL